MRHKNSPINLTKPKFRISVYQDTIKREGHLQPKEKKNYQRYHTPKYHGEMTTIQRKSSKNIYKYFPRGNSKWPINIERCLFSLVIRKIQIKTMR